MVTDANPFGDIDRQYAETMKKHLDLALELDSMEEDVTSWEAGFLNDIIIWIRDKKQSLTQPQLDTLYKICDRYGIDRDED